MKLKSKILLNFYLIVSTYRNYILFNQIIHIGPFIFNLWVGLRPAPWRPPFGRAEPSAPGGIGVKKKNKKKRGRHVLFTLTIKSFLTRTYASPLWGDAFASSETIRSLILSKLSVVYIANLGRISSIPPSVGGGDAS
uniref:Uncharacterized protein n=1 Tax=Morchella brunnea TaxID=1174671 RepID=A0A8K1I811_9PEZI|nr:hypothetical protein LK370_mgp150 [Morchella brunnea]UBU98379.1 hypothetical protein [Morchella brunnea]